MRLLLEEDYPGELAARGGLAVKAIRERVADARAREDHHSPFPAIQEATAATDTVFRDQIARMVGDISKVLRRGA